ncbi:MAG: hypothetical protein HC769_02685 [Cyanobacteria bacterium CRU_2_1]|nr:hypothetical protein [Cyanobacteria bacterium CRU_2_1]
MGSTQPAGRFTRKNQREFIANIIQRYRYRGTKANLQELLKLFLVGMPEVIETEAAHSFRVRVSFPRPAPSEDARRALGRQIDIARSIVDLEKPAHTAYDRVEPVFPSMQIGELSTRRGFSTIGVDTLLGVVPIDERSLQSQSSQANASEISTDASSETNTTPEINPFTPNIEANMSPDTNPSDDATTNL